MDNIAIKFSLMVLLVAGLLPIASLAAEWEWISSAGAGVKIDSTSSFLTLPACKKAAPVKLVDGEWVVDIYVRTSADCGGDNPVFIGWPIAAKRSFSRGRGEFQIGWFHQSQWFAEDEIHFDCICMMSEFNWSRSF